MTTIQKTEAEKKSRHLNGRKEFHKDDCRPGNNFGALSYLRPGNEIDELWLGC